MSDKNPGKFQPLKAVLKIFTPHKTVPKVSWTAHHRWDIAPMRLFILIFGLAIFGLGDAALVQSHIGNSPWTVFAEGLSLHAPISIGVATFCISALVLALWIPLGEKPGLGTVANMIVIALFLQIGVNVLPSIHHNLFLSTVMSLIGIGAVGIGSALYITCGLGPGPRDGLMTSLHHKTGVRVGRMRLMIECCAVAVGMLLGGTAGVGTALFALLIGNSVAIAFAIVNQFAN